MILPRSAQAVRTAPHSTCPHAVTLTCRSIGSHSLLRPPLLLSSKTLIRTLQLVSSPTHHTRHIQNNDRLNTLPPHKPPNRPNSNLPNRLFNPLSHLYRLRRLDLGLPPPLPSPHNPRFHRHLHNPRKLHSSVLHCRPQWNYSRQYDVGAEKERYGLEIWLQYLVYA
jgi:hypothetical protein